MVIVGAGHVGGRAAQALREFGWGGDILLIGEEIHLPYERPPLSKALLTGERDLASARFLVVQTRVDLVACGSLQRSEYKSKLVER